MIFLATDSSDLDEEEDLDAFLEVFVTKGTDLATGTGSSASSRSDPSDSTFLDFFETAAKQKF